MLHCRCEKSAKLLHTQQHRSLTLQLAFKRSDFGTLLRQKGVNLFHTAHSNAAIKECRI